MGEVMLAALGISLMAVAGCRPTVPAEAAVAVAKAHSPVHAGSRVLMAGDLVAEVMEPDDPQRYNRGVRFTPLAAVLGVRMAGHEFLFNPVEHNAIDDHAGLASEFDLVTPDDPDDWMPPGYLEAKAGEGFVKIGVGVLQKQDDRYSLFQQPQIIERAHTQVIWKADAAEFHQTCSGTNGYAYELSAKVAVRSDHVKVDWTLLNTGKKPFTTRQYTHNFFRFDNYNVGPDYTLGFPYDFQAEGLQPEQEQIGREIRFVKQVPQWVNLVVPYPKDYTGANTCVVRQETSGASVLCTTSLPGLRTAVHARPGYVSPEQFIELTVNPGKEVKWSRGYRFLNASVVPRSIRE
jgi:hypothetical protein